MYRYDFEQKQTSFTDIYLLIIFSCAVKAGEIIIILNFGAVRYNYIKILVLTVDAIIAFWGGIFVVLQFKGVEKQPSN